VNSTEILLRKYEFDYRRVDKDFVKQQISERLWQTESGSADLVCLLIKPVPGRP